MFKIIKEDVKDELIEKKSKFIAHVFYVETITEAEEKLETVKKEYHDARHNCYAYRVVEQGSIVQKSSDDGEPSGTAGGPMLTILSKNEIANVLVVVTRYFGGILLGTGGLVRAYSDVTSNALKKAKIITMEPGYEIEVILTYSELENFKYFCRQNDVKIKKEEYLENIKLTIECSEEIKEKIQQKNLKCNQNLLEMRIIRKKYIEKNIEK